MLFSTYEFIFVFLPITLTGFFYIGSRGHHRIANTWLVVASLVYYGWWNPAYLVLILLSMVFNYSFGVTLGQKDQLSSKYKSNKKGLLTLGVIVNLGLLGYFKYANFFVDSLNSLSGTNFNLEKIILPLAISFFTFQQVAYLVDAFRGEAREYNFLHYCLFVCFFPQLIAGPIVHHKEMLPQFAKESTYKVNLENIAIGFTIFFIGLFKKVVLADSLALYVDPAFSSSADIGFIQSWVGALAYTFQLYFDFSGYSDMALGIARMFGIRLPINFNSPYKSQSIIEFWRRWHITLSTFLRDYLYFSLGGNRGGKIRKHFNLMMTMLLGGLWHGAGWTFVVWGGLHGLYLILNHFFRAMLETVGFTMKADNYIVKVLSRFITFIAVVIGWVFFRAVDFDQALHLLEGMFGINGLAPISLKDDVPAFLLIIISFFIVWYLPNAQQYMQQFHLGNKKTKHNETSGFVSRVLNFKYNKTSVMVVTLLILVTFLMMQSVQKSEFLYYDF